MKILVADDEEVGRYRLQAMLTKQGYEVIPVGDGAAAWEILQQHDAPRLVIMDWMMPGMSGLDLCRNIRGSGSAAYVYIIMLTAKGDKQDIVAGMEAGADDYLSKPFHTEELRVRLRAGERIVALQAELQLQASHDALTGTLNRGAIFDMLRRQLAQSVRDGSPVSIILADLDHFKQINDTHGHPVGDAVLREAAKRFLAPLRPYDALGRYGGEEFLIVLPGCGIEHARAVAERVRTSISGRPMVTPAAAIGVTASMGVAASETGEPVDIDVLVKRADEALYRAKRGGRNRVEA